MKLLIFIVFLTFFSSCSVKQNKTIYTNNTLKRNEAIKIAEKTALSFGFYPPAMKLETRIFIDTNNKYCKHLNPITFVSIENKEYWVVYYSPKNVNQTT